VSIPRNNKTYIQNTHHFRGYKLTKLGLVEERLFTQDGLQELDASSRSSEVARSWRGLCPAVDCSGLMMMMIEELTYENDVWLQEKFLTNDALSIIFKAPLLGHKFRLGNFFKAHFHICYLFVGSSAFLTSQTRTRHANRSYLVQFSILHSFGLDIFAGN
jgi:hypothetical protein